MFDNGVNVYSGDIQVHTCIKKSITPIDFRTVRTVWNNMIFILLPLYYPCKIRSAALRKKKGYKLCFAFRHRILLFPIFYAARSEIESVFLHGIHFNQSIQ
jgi:hypothetical protein